MSEELKPCPFCGGKPHISDDGIDETHYKAILCDCGVGTHYYSTVEESSLVWNRRSDAALAADLSARLEETVDLLKRNIGEGYPFDADSGECYFCGKGEPRKHDDGEIWTFEDDIEHLESPLGHKKDCAWRMATEYIARLGSPSPVAALKDKVVEAARETFNVQRTRGIPWSPEEDLRRAIAALDAAQAQEKP